MSGIDYPDRHHLSAADGWLDLGDTEEALRSLDAVSPATSADPDVLELRWRILARRLAWDEALKVSSQLTAAAPNRAESWIHHSYALHELKRTEEAWTTLLQAAPRFPKESIIPYNLACYACQMGEVQVARSWLQRAMRLRPREEIRSMALQDPDLAPLHAFLREK